MRKSHAGIAPIMRQRLALGFLLMCCAGWLLFPTMAQAHPTVVTDPDYRNYAFQIQANGDIDVEEHWQFTLDRRRLLLPHFIAQISLLYVTNITVGTVAGSPFADQQISQTKDKYGNPVEQVEWSATSSANMVLTYSLPYTLHGALGVTANSAWFDHLLFDPGSAYSGDQSLITLTFPPLIAAKDIAFTEHYPGQALSATWLDAHTLKLFLAPPNNDNYLEILAVIPRAQLQPSPQKPAWQLADGMPTLPTKTPPNTAVDPPLWIFIILVCLGLGFLIFILLVYPSQVAFLSRRRRSSTPPPSGSRFSPGANIYANVHQPRKRKVRQHS